MTWTKQINNETGAVLNRDFPRRGRSLIIGAEDFGRFLRQAKEDGFYEFFLLELGTGMRRGEMLGLMWDDLNFRTGELHVCRQVCAVDGRLEISAPK